MNTAKTYTVTRKPFERHPLKVTMQTEGQPALLADQAIVLVFAALDVMEEDYESHRGGHVRADEGRLWRFLFQMGAEPESVPESLREIALVIADGEENKRAPFTKWLTVIGNQASTSGAAAAP